MIRSKICGPVLAVYPDKTTSPYFLILLSTLSFTAISLPLLKVLLNAVPDFKAHGLLFAIRNNIILLGLSFLATLTMAILLNLHCERSHHKVVVYKNGVSIQLKKICYLNWNQIAGISAKFVQHKLLFKNTTKSIRCNIFTNEGKWIEIPYSIKNQSRFLTVLKSQIYPKLQPKIMEQFNEGSITKFGVVSIKKPYIIYKNKSFRIEQIKYINIKSGCLKIEFLDARNKIKISLHHILNAELLINLFKCMSTPIISYD